jgi:hypothetical protein
VLVTAEVLNSPIPVTLKREALSFSETSVLTGATHRNIPKDGNLWNIIVECHKNLRGMQEGTEAATRIHNLRPGTWVTNSKSMSRNFQRRGSKKQKPPLRSSVLHGLSDFPCFLKEGLCYLHPLLFVSESPLIWICMPEHIVMSRHLSCI